MQTLGHGKWAKLLPVEYFYFPLLLFEWPLGHFCPEGDLCPVDGLLFYPAHRHLQFGSDHLLVGTIFGGLGKEWVVILHDP